MRRSCRARPLGGLGGIRRADRASRRATACRQINQFGTSLWALQGLGSVWMSSPVVATIDGVKAVVLATLSGEIYVVNAKTGRELPGWPQWVHIHSRTPTGVDSSPAVAYLDGPDRPPSIIVGAGSLWRRNQQGGLEAFYASGKVRFVFQTQRTFNPWGIGPNDYSDPVFATPAVGDITGTGQQDIVFGSYDHNIYALQPDGHLVPRLPDPARRHDLVLADPGRHQPHRPRRHHHGWRLERLGRLLRGLDRRLPLRHDASEARLAALRQPDGLVEPDRRDSQQHRAGPPSSSGPAGTRYYSRNPATDEILAVYADNGQNVPGWPVKASGPTFGSPAIGRIDGQTGGRLDIVRPLHERPGDSERLERLRPQDLVQGLRPAPRGNLVSRARRRHGRARQRRRRAHRWRPGPVPDRRATTASSSTTPVLSSPPCSRAATSPATRPSSYVPGAPGNGWMLYFACGGPTIAGEAGRLPLPDALRPPTNPPAWPEWRANADRTGIADPLSVPRTSCCQVERRARRLRALVSE